MPYRYLSLKTETNTRVPYLQAIYQHMYQAVNSRIVDAQQLTTWIIVECCIRFYALNYDALPETLRIMAVDIDDCRSSFTKKVGKLSESFRQNLAQEATTRGFEQAKKISGTLVDIVGSLASIVYVNPGIDGTS